MLSVSSRRRRRCPASPTPFPGGETNHGGEITRAHHLCHPLFHVHHVQGPRRRLPATAAAAAATPLDAQLPATAEAAQAHRVLVGDVALIHVTHRQDEIDALGFENVLRLKAEDDV